MRGSLWLVVVSALPGCGVGALQTARTLAPGEKQVVISQGALRNGARDGTTLPQQVSLRAGVAGGVDVGVSTLLGSGLLLDAKVGLPSPARAVALSVRAGVGGALPAIAGAGVLHVPVALHTSIDVGSGFTPYGMAAYQAYWIYGYDSDCPAVARCVGRQGHGDGVIALSLGLAWRGAGGRGFMLEYGRLVPVVDDPGDHFTFMTSHFVMAGVSL